ncbi:hypothetical protein IHQ68_14885 [Chelatococcus sambhunathii]|uniref:Uncharacterized protein n=1 Tax=Chelatococcus sambhunathii TaxID=363953 RepID=A0ABU1DIG7_9HYPH|nr:hypothetical protein [Chelatococcus sambhunathii]MDR4307905.1 hypothetical protein [Chelatococcus sambhunathii]
MHLDTHYRAEVMASERIIGGFRAALAYMALGLGLTGTLAIVPSIVALLAARGFQ